jgi:hypothetical protein
MNVSSQVILGGASPKYDRHKSDFYETPPEATQGLLDAMPIDVFGPCVWEPAAGAGAISAVLRAAGKSVIESDITTGQDFLFSPVPKGVTSIITNPPFNLADDFIKRAFRTKLPFALLLKATFWNGKRHAEIFKATGPMLVAPLTWRPVMAPERGESPTMDFCWTVWGAYPSTFCTYIPLLKS